MRLPKVLPLVGYKSLKALNAFHSLMLGLKQLPEYYSESYESFFTRVHGLDFIDQENILRKAAMFVEILPDELEALVCFCTDKNGIPFTKENIKNLGPKDFHEIIVAVCLEISKIKVDFVSEDEKKKSENSQLI